MTTNGPNRNLTKIWSVNLSLHYVGAWEQPTTQWIIWRSWSCAFPFPTWESKASLIRRNHYPDLTCTDLLLGPKIAGGHAHTHTQKYVAPAMWMSAFHFKFEPVIRAGFRFCNSWKTSVWLSSSPGSRAYHDRLKTPGGLNAHHTKAHHTKARQRHTSDTLPKQCFSADSTLYTWHAVGGCELRVCLRVL